MRRVEVTDYCDRHRITNGDDDRTPAVASIAFVYRGKPLRYDHCGDAECTDPLWSVILACAVPDSDQDMPKPNGKRAALPKGSKMIRCPECGQGFYSQQGLAAHSQVHTRDDFPCPQCEFVAANGTGLSAHIRAKHREDVRPER